MKPWSVLILCALALPAAGAERVLLVLGDSLSAGYGIAIEEGWVSLLGKRLEARGGGWRVVNASVSGDTTAGGLARLPRLLDEYRPEVVVIELGSNDGLRGFAFGQIRRNLRQMIRLSREARARPALLGGMLPPNYGAAYADAFHELFREVAASDDIPLVPFLLEGVADDPELMQADGYHPNAQAQTRMLANVWPALREMLDGAPQRADRTWGTQGE
jgi:acyl-CoA thioesterase-1